MEKRLIREQKIMSTSKSKRHHSTRKSFQTKIDTAIIRIIKIKAAENEVPIEDFLNVHLAKTLGVGKPLAEADR